MTNVPASPTARRRRYSVTVDGFDAVRFEARSASAARYAAFKAFREAGYRLTFREFLGRIITHHFGAAS